MPSISDLNIPGYDNAAGVYQAGQQFAANPTPNPEVNGFLSKYHQAMIGHPSKGAFAGTSVARTMNTALYGGWKTDQDIQPMMSLGKHIPLFSEKVHPATFVRHPTSAIFGEDPKYNPFGTATMMNNAGEFGMRHSSYIRNSFIKRGFVTEEQATAVATDKTANAPIFEGGFLGKMSGARRLDRMRKAKDAAQLPQKVMNMSKNMENVIGQGRNGQELLDSARMGQMSYQDAVGLSSRGALGQGIGAFQMSARGGVTDVGQAAIDSSSAFAKKMSLYGEDLAAKRAAFAGGETGLRAGGQVMRGAVTEARNSAYSASMEGAAKEAGVDVLEGAAKATAEASAETAAKMAAVKIGASTAMELGADAAGNLALDWIPFLGEAMMVKTAFDLAKTGTGLAKAFIIDPAAKLAKDSITSFKGASTKPVFGMGFTDTPESITDRQRGVAAIQNSRLNARSILGVEAGYAHAHFG